MYHNIRCPHRRRGPQRVSDGRTVKPVTNHPENRHTRTGSILALCMAMHSDCMECSFVRKEHSNPRF
ncbi:hypothetical protein FOT17_25390 [Escherichia coli]|nr:hypothetical protein [Escherichia coli]